MDLIAHPATAGRHRPGELPLFDYDATEGVRVGYKWFESEHKDPLFPFGFGLSYTSYVYSGLSASQHEVSFTVRNSGSRAGTEVAQVYAVLPASTGESTFKRLIAMGSRRTRARRIENRHPQARTHSISPFSTWAKTPSPSRPAITRFSPAPPLPIRPSPRRSTSTSKLHTKGKRLRIPTRIRSRIFFVPARYRLPATGCFSQFAPNSGLGGVAGTALAGG